jgi:chromosome segregation protein
MKLAFLELCGFRGYRRPVRIKFGESFTIIDGRNGSGKSTIFDAIEFALTGSLSKYNDAKASGETVADYLWWTGKSEEPLDRYVEVGFREHDELFVVRRTPLGELDAKPLEELRRRMCDADASPDDPFRQLCAASIIRDEHITSLSLDLKEADRYSLLRHALGANNANEWIERGAHVVAHSKRRVAAAEADVAKCTAEVAAALRSRDQARAILVSDAVLSEVVTRLRSFVGATSPPEELTSETRGRIGNLVDEIEQLRKISGAW